MKKHIPIISLLLCAGAATGGTLRSYYRLPDGKTYRGPDSTVVSPEVISTPTQATGREFTAVPGDGQKVEWYYYDGSPLTGGEPEGRCGEGTPINLKIDDSADHTLVAHFEYVKYTLQYVTNGVTYREETHAYADEVTVRSVPDGTPSKGHHYSTSWSVKSGGKVASGDTVTGETFALQNQHTDGKVIILTAGEEVNTYAIEYDLGGGAWTNDPPSVTYEPPKKGTWGRTLQIRNPRRTGHAFNGWKSSATGAICSTSDGAFAATVKDLTDRQGEKVTLTADWTPVPPVNWYCLGFDPGNARPVDGRTDLKPLTLTNDVPVKLEDLNPAVYSNYVDQDDLRGFVGWSNTVQHAVYTNGVTVTNAYEALGTTNVLVAVWKSKRPPLSQAMHCGNLDWESTGGDNKWIATNETGIGYNTDSCVRQLGGPQNKEWLYAEITTNGCLSFKWKRTGQVDGANKLGITTDLNHYFYSPENPDERGWSSFSTNLTVSGGSVSLFLRFDSPVQGTCDIDQMKWEPEEDTYVLHFDASGGDAASVPADVAVSLGKGARLPKDVPTSEGKVFDGWTTNKAVNAEFHPGDWFEDKAAKKDSTNTFFAVWSPVPEPPVKIGIPVAATNLSYNGSVQRGVTNGTGYVLSGNEWTYPGQYTTTATLENGYVWSDGTREPKMIGWAIAAGSYDMSGVTFESRAFRYDGKPHALEISGKLPQGVTVEYEGNGKTEVGDYPVRAIFTGEDADMAPIDPMTATLTITNGVPFAGNANYGGCLMKDGAVFGTVVVKVAKVGSDGTAKVKLTIQPLGGKKVTLTEYVPVGGYPTVGGLSYSGTEITGKIKVNGVEYDLVTTADALTSPDRETKTAAKNSVPSGTWTFALTNGVGDAELGFSVTVAAKTGKAKLKGLLPNGKKISLTATSVFGPDLKVLSTPVAYSKKDVTFSFLLQVDVATKAMTLSALSMPDMAPVGPSALFAADSGLYGFLCPLEGTKYLTAVSGMLPGETVNVAPTGVTVTVYGEKWTVEKSVGTVKAEDGRPYVKYNPEKQSPANVSKLKLKWAYKTGIVSGSFKLYYLADGKLKNESAAVNGVVVDGELYGFAWVKKSLLVLPVGLIPTPPAN